MSPPSPALIDRSDPADPATLGRWRARLDALTRWCLSDAPLAPAAAVVAAAVRPTLGDLLRRALARAGDGVVDLLDALDAPTEPAHRARLTRVLGGDVLLVVVTARGGAIQRAEARACRTTEEATALVGAFLGGAVAPWMVAAGAHVRDAIAGPLLIAPIDGGTAPASHGALARLLGDTSAESTLVLPLLTLAGDDVPAALEATSDALPPPAPPVMLGMPSDGTPAPTVLGGVLRPGSAFLDAPAIGAFDPIFGAEPDDEDEAEGGVVGAVDAEPAPDDDALEDDPAAIDDEPLIILAEPAPTRFVAAAAEDDDEVPPVVPSALAAAALERVRARQAPVDRVSVVVASDDGVAEHLGDAAAWLAEASEQELRALARGGWSGDAAVELALAADDPEIADVARQARRHEAELVVEIDPDEAVTWLRRHRPETAERLEAVL